MLTRKHKVSYEKCQRHRRQLSSLSDPLCSFTSPFLLCSQEPVSLWRDLKLLDCGRRTLPKTYSPLHLLSQSSPARRDQNTSPHCKSQIFKWCLPKPWIIPTHHPAPAAHTLGKGKKARSFTITWVKDSGKNKTGLFTTFESSLFN